MESEESANPSRSRRYEDVESNHGDERTNQREGRSSGTRRNFRFWGRKSNDVLGLEEPRLQIFSYDELREATRGFHDKIMIDFDGSTYKGFLKGRPVAVKVPGDDVGASITEIKVAGRLCHRNLVQLLGWSYERKHLLLVYEFISNATLSDHLWFSSTDPSGPSLPWEVRYWKIAMGLASALLYMQEELETCVIHRDIKSSNVLLDSNFNPKLTNFGVSLFLPSDELETDSFPIVGTIDYIDPMYAKTGKCSKLSDVHSFGMVALEIATGRKAWDRSRDRFFSLQGWVQMLHEEGVILEAADPKLANAFNEQEMERLLLVGLWCTNEKPESRPSIRLILKLLNFEVLMPSNMWDRGSSSSSPASSEERTMLHEFLADRGDYENICSHPAASSATLIQETASSSISTKGADAASPQSNDDATTTKLKQRCSVQAANRTSLTPFSFQDEEEEDARVAPAIVPAETTFDIGIPPEYGTTNVIHPRRDHHQCVLDGLVQSLSTRCCKTKASRSTLLRF